MNKEKFERVFNNVFLVLGIMLAISYWIGGVLK